MGVFFTKFFTISFDTLQKRVNVQSGFLGVKDLKVIFKSWLSSTHCSVQIQRISNEEKSES